jgi:polar amino acid transport system substrate-binding protein
LTYDLAEFLSRNSDGRYQFQVTLWPRNRLSQILNQGDEVVVPWTQPAWFKDPQRERYLWTDGYFPGRNAIISSVGRPIDYAGPKSLEGLSLVGLRGGRWPQFEQLIEQGKIERVNTSSYLAAMKMAALGRADAALVPSLVARYLMANDASVKGMLYLSPTPSSRYHRHFLINGRQDVRDYLQTQVPILLNSGVIDRLLKHYGM